MDKREERLPHPPPLSLSYHLGENTIPPLSLTTWGRIPTPLSLTTIPSHFVYSPELGTRQYRRDNVTMCSGHRVVCYCNVTIFIVITPYRHRYLNIFLIFSVPETLLHCRVVVVAKLKN